MIRDDSSAPQGTDFLAFFAFLVGVELASAHTDAAAALLDYTEDKMPSASEYVNALADALAGKRPPRISARTLAALFSKN